MKTSRWASGACVVLVAGLAHGTDYNLFGDISGAQSMGFLGDPENELYSIHTLGPGPTITQVAWDVNLTTLGNSWADEAAFTITDFAGNSVTIIPGASDGFPVTDANYFGSTAVSLRPMGGPMLLEFHEIGFDDNLNAADAIFGAGSELRFSSFGIEHFVKIQAVPSPGGAVVIGAGLVLGWRRRRVG